MGTPEFSVPPLEAVAFSCDVTLVLTQPDRPKGRGRALAESPVAVRASALGLPVLKPADMKAPEVRERLAAERADVIAVVAFGASLTPAVLALPRCGAIHPHGSVPALVDGDLKLWESSAIVMHLADKFPDAHLAPALGTDARAQYYRWIVYVPATVDPVLETLTMHTRFLPEEKRNPALVADATRRLGNITTVLETALDGKAFIVGDSFTAADIVVASAIGWIGFLGLLGDHPKLAAYLDGAGFDVVVFTATRQLRNSIRKWNATTFDFGPANGDRLGDDKARWGAYYDTDPHVLAVHLKPFRACVGTDAALATMLRGVWDEAWFDGSQHRRLERAS